MSTVSEVASGPRDPSEMEPDASRILRSRRLRFIQGCEEYPLRAGLVRVATQNLKESSARWKALIGGLIGPDALNVPFIEQDSVAECCRLYGQGRCELDFPAGGIGSIKIHKRSLWALSRLPVARCEGVPKVKLVLLKPRPGLVPLVLPEQQPRIALIPFALYSPVTQVYWDCEVISDGPVQPGSEVAIKMALNSFMTDAQMAQWMTQQLMGINIVHLNYRFLSLSRMEILDCEDVTDAVQRLAAGTKLDEERELLQKLCREFRNTAPRKPRSRRGKPSGSSSGVGASAGDEGPVDDGGEDLGDDIDEADPAPVWEAKDEWADALAPDEDEALPVVQQDGPTVELFLDPSDLRRKWGRLSMFKAGTTSESLGMYCYRHGCSKTRTPKRMLNRLTLRRWLLAGQALPAGKDGKDAHMKMFEELEKAQAAK